MKHRCGVEIRSYEIINVLPCRQNVNLKVRTDKFQDQFSVYASYCPPNQMNQWHLFRTWSNVTSFKVQTSQEGKGSKIFYDWYSQLLNSFTKQECKFTDWITDCRIFFKQEVINIRGMHNDTDADLAENLWWSFCLLFVLGS